MSAIKPLFSNNLARDSANATKRALSYLDWLYSSPPANIESLKQVHREAKAARIMAEARTSKLV